jgi:hypothetical protein
VFLLLDGILGVEVNDRQIAQVGPGAIVGERALLEEGVRTASRARSDSTVRIGDEQLKFPGPASRYALCGLIGQVVESLSVVWRQELTAGHARIQLMTREGSVGIPHDLESRRPADRLHRTPFGRLADRSLHPRRSERPLEDD